MLQFLIGFFTIGFLTPLSPLALPISIIHKVRQTGNNADTFINLVSALVGTLGIAAYVFLTPIAIMYPVPFAFGYCVYCFAGALFFANCLN